MDMRAFVVTPHLGLALAVKSRDHNTADGWRIRSIRGIRDLKTYIGFHSLTLEFQDETFAVCVSRKKRNRKIKDEVVGR